MDLVYISIKKEDLIKAYGLMICRMDGEFKNGKMEVVIKASSKME